MFYPNRKKSMPRERAESWLHLLTKTLMFSSLTSSPKRLNFWILLVIFFVKKSIDLFDSLVWAKLASVSSTQFWTMAWIEFKSNPLHLSRSNIFRVFPFWQQNLSIIFEAIFKLYIDNFCKDLHEDSKSSRIVPLESQSDKSRYLNWDISQRFKLPSSLALYR